MDVCSEVKLRTLFDPVTRTRGKIYFDQHRVTLSRHEAYYAAARVRGSRGQYYAVTIDNREHLDAPRFSCECPLFAKKVLCKHLWATLLACDDHRDGSRSLKARSGKSRSSKPRNATRRQSPLWETQLRGLQQTVARAQVSHTMTSAEQLIHSKFQYWFVISLSDHVADARLVLRIYRSQRRMDGSQGARQQCDVDPKSLAAVFDPTDREIFSMLVPDDDSRTQRGYGAPYEYGCEAFGIPTPFPDRLFELLASTGRFVWTLDADRTLVNDSQIHWSGGEPWALHVRASKDPAMGADSIALTACLQRADECREVSGIAGAFADGLVLFDDSLARVRPQDAPWLTAWQRSGTIRFDESQMDSVLNSLATMAGIPAIEFDPELNIAINTAQPTPKLVVAPVVERWSSRESANLNVSLLAKYGTVEIDLNSSANAFWNAAERAWTVRDVVAEQGHLADLMRFPFQATSDYRGRTTDATINRKWLPDLVRDLVPKGWEVVANGKKVRTAGSFNIGVTSGVDWFDVEATADFGGITASLPALLESMRKNERMILLGDGSLGMLPDEWLAKYAKLAELGAADGDSVRFSKIQAVLLDALLAEQANVVKDRDFNKYCKKIESFQGIEPASPPPSFVGELRPYQRDGLGWLEFLRDFDFGGCLADDMGLGKTIQVLAMLDGRRSRRLKKGEQRLPSLVIVPKSLVFNWIDEAARFTPKLRVVNYTGTDRSNELADLQGGDLLITTYGTMLRDIMQIKEISFDYLILDEAQAIKNTGSQSAKACRLLRGRHRLAMTGTPVENHVGELWSLIDFLNPGMLGDASAFRKVATGNNGSTESLQWLNRSLRPFLLRRTKEQVLQDLPEKTEQTLYCHMTPSQSKLYTELKNHYRSHIGKKVDELGIKRSKIHVLEALLRLRQAACDPRLLDKNQSADGAKIELLMEQLEEVRAEGHKALVFSQFTSLLALVRHEVEEREWTYEYLDGKTTNRRDKVQRFQSDTDCQLFLISLKAGGHGLNLTAADYVFILDPWWNPAVESQAIDRAHRIGQSRPVMAYRIICRDTVEEKIVELQQTKRDLADAIVTADESLISRLSLDDLQILFS